MRANALPLFPFPPLERIERRSPPTHVSHLAHVGDEMAAGLGGLFADAFPEVPTLDEIEVGFTFSKKDAAHLAASLDVPERKLVANSGV